ncbi:MAG TPA: NADH-quinone oxidoreductase subunit M [Bacteroidales bacterium]|nr:NADH-quinone oxidoreductase subunit M [Bacteroidales bacterium]
MLTLVLLLFPLALSLILLFFREVKTLRVLAFTGTLAELALAIAAFVQYKTSCHCNLLFSFDWLDTLGVSLKFGMDGITLLLVMLTALLVPIIVFSTFSHHYSSPASFYSLILLMEMALIGVFTAFDGLVFYIFWEMALIPAWFICALWGGNNRIRITFKFFIYTFAGSILMLVALIYLYFKTPLPHAFDFQALYAAALTPAEQTWIFLAFFLAFAIKIPVFPFHTWQPDTYTESPAAGSMLLAGIMLKMGLFGMIRWMIPICSQSIRQWGDMAIILAITGIVYASLIALRQNDLKRLIAWSSIAHAGLMAAALLVMNLKASQGAMIQMVAHGINITGLFLITDLIQRRTGTRNITELGGIALRAPRLAAFFMVILLGSIALPLTNGFVGEFLMLLGIFEYNALYAAIAGLTMIFGAVYMLWMYQRVMLGKTQPATEGFQDLTLAEMGMLLPLVILIFWMGCYPSFFLDIPFPDVQQILYFVK